MSEGSESDRVQQIMELAQSRGISKWRLQSKVEKLEHFLEPGERVAEVAYGRAGATFIGGLTGKLIIACTDRRVILPSAVWGKGVPLDEIVSVTSKTFPTMGRVEIYLQKTRRVTFKEIQPKRGAEALELAIRSRLEQTPGTPTTAPEANSGIANELEKVAKLHKDGHLTDEEFAEAKARALSQE